MFNQGAENLSFADQMLLADIFIQCLRPEPAGQGLAGGFLIEKTHLFIHFFSGSSLYQKACGLRRVLLRPCIRYLTAGSGKCHLAVRPASHCFGGTPPAPDVPEGELRRQRHFTFP